MSIWELAACRHCVRNSGIELGGGFVGAESTGGLNTQVVSMGHPVKGNLSRDLIGWGESQVAG